MLHLVTIWLYIVYFILISCRYAAECTPPAIRGALVMQWQMWTAFGIMIGYAADLAFYHVPDTATVTGLNWRLMMASAMMPAVIVCCFVYNCPESPRW
jgi:Sugar (and other) transporter